MVPVFRTWFTALLLVLMAPPLVSAQDKALPKSVTTQPERSAFKEAVSDLFSLSNWWLWLGIVVVIGLVGVLFYMRNKRDED